ncbi:hypothetical protein ACT3CD_11125 [Geofilum sp. OHC36d9]|uniref:hypothetical protein n=1 Tax=Geofilum sp. OHC36d9 TaxID=3458413 RepID=UPI0040342FA8
MGKVYTSFGFIKSLRFAFIFVVLFLTGIFSGDLLAQQASNAKLVSLNKRMAVIEKNHQAHLSKLQEADSLIATSSVLAEQLNDEIVKVTAEMDAKSKKYKQQKKALAKKSKEATPEEITQLQLYEREIDNQYRADLRAFDTQMKKMLSGVDKAVYATKKGKQYKIQAESRLKETATQMAELHSEIAKYSALSGDMADNR